MAKRLPLYLAALLCLGAGLFLWFGRRGAPPAEETDEIDFYQASGITQAELEGFLEGMAISSNLHDFPLHITLQNDQGDYLADSRAIVRWNGGEQRLLVGRSAVIQVLLEKQKLPGLRLIVPRGFTRLKQKTIPLGTAYAPEGKLDVAGLKYDVNWDGRINSDLNRALQRMQALGESVDDRQVRRQLRRKSFPLPLPEPPDEELTPAEIYQQRRDAVVIIGTLFGDGNYTVASGVIVDPAGIVATAYHVIDKPPPVLARGVMTHSGKVYAVREILAADKPSDVALLKIDASNLAAAPVSHGDPEGAPVTVISHPSSNFFSLTQGYISRYWAATSYGELTVRMSVTADFADGSSGGPIFNSRGAVTGVVSATDAFGDQMVRRSAAPADAIRRLVRQPAAQPRDPTEAQQE
jgi:S1-C subfamily serine protease